MPQHANPSAIQQLPPEAPRNTGGMTGDRYAGPAHWPECRRCRRWGFAIWVLSLCLATATGTLLACRFLGVSAAPKRGEAARCLEFLEQLSSAAAVGIIKVDQDKLDEIICVVTEARLAEDASPDSEACGAR